MQRYLIASVLFIVMSLPIWANQPNADVSALSHRLKHLHTLQAHFKQTVTSSNGDVLQRSSGQVMLKRPDHFKWQIQQPMPQTIIADGQYLWVYQPDLKQITKRKLQKRIGQIPLLLLTEQKVDLTQNFQVKQLSANTFQLTPKKQANFAHIRLQFASHKLQQMTLTMGGGQTTQIRLKNSHVNRAITDDRFKIEAGQDVQVINLVKSS